MLNCVYDCRYCFLQGMFRSAHYVVFVNYDDFVSAIQGAAGTWFYSGYDCDSLALEPMTRFMQFFLPRIRHLDGAWLELRTKSTQIRTLLEQDRYPMSSSRTASRRTKYPGSWNTRCPRCADAWPRCRNCRALDGVSVCDSIH